MKLKLFIFGLVSFAQLTTGAVFAEEIGSYIFQREQPSRSDSNQVQNRTCKFKKALMVSREESPTTPVTIDEVTLQLVETKKASSVFWYGEGHDKYAKPDRAVKLNDLTLKSRKHISTNVAAQCKIYYTDMMVVFNEVMSKKYQHETIETLPGIQQITKYLAERREDLNWEVRHRKAPTSISDTVLQRLLEPANQHGENMK